MLEVFYKGEGDWYDVDNVRGTITGTIQANGIFRLTNDDEITYKHTKSLDSIRFLLPSTTHLNCEFLKSQRLGLIDSEYSNNSAFRIYYNEYQWKTCTKILTIIEPQTEAVGDAGTGNHAGTETKPLNQNSNNSDFSGLLNNPSKKDDWFSVIDDMTRGFYDRLGKMPNETQAWGALWTSPPEGYEITTGKDRGDDCLIMPSITTLSKRAFSERWKKYTAKSQDKAF
ncbi:MAG: hypothetical protein QX196_06305 [Methylococcaceae bacterium]